MAVPEARRRLMLDSYQTREGIEGAGHARDEAAFARAEAAGY
jgi:hypothetical protein